MSDDEVLTSCCICQTSLNESNSKNIFEEIIGDPPKIISDVLINQILSDVGHNYEFSNECFTCESCEEKILNFYNSILVSEKLKQDILKLMNMSYGDTQPYSTFQEFGGKVEEEHSSVYEKYELLEDEDAEFLGNVLLFFLSY